MDEIIQGLNLVYLVSLASLIDVSLTYYIMWLDTQLNGKDKKYVELNSLAAGIMKVTKTGPLGLLIGALTSQIIIWGAMFFALRGGSVFTALQFIQFTAGALFVVIWIHTYSIRSLQRVRKARAMVGLEKMG